MPSSRAASAMLRAERSGVPARIAVIDGRTIEGWEPRLLADALAMQPGISLYDDLGTPWKLNLMARGFTAGPTVGLPPGVSVFRDGVRQNEPAAQEVDFDLLPLAHVARVVLGGSASLLGPNSLGGTINLATEGGSGPLAGDLEVALVQRPRPRRLPRQPTRRATTTWRPAAACRSSPSIR